MQLIREMNWQIRQNITIQWLYKPKMAIKFLEWRTSARVTKILAKLNTSVLKRDSVYIIWTKIDNFEYEKSKHLYRYITYIYFCFYFTHIQFLSLTTFSFSGSKLTIHCHNSRIDLSIGVICYVLPISSPTQTLFILFVSVDIWYEWKN
jgi:hypothetical protein